MHVRSGRLTWSAVIFFAACAGDDTTSDDAGETGVAAAPADGPQADATGAGEDEGGADVNASGSATAGGGDFLGACDTRTMGNDVVLGQCRDWFGEPGPDLEVSCDGIGGIFSMTPCPGEDRLGTCTLDPVLGIVAVYGFYAPTTLDEAMQICEGLEGAWAP